MSANSHYDDHDDDDAFAGMGALGGAPDEEVAVQENASEAAEDSDDGASQNNPDEDQDEIDVFQNSQIADYVHECTIAGTVYNQTAFKQFLRTNPDPTVFANATATLNARAGRQKLKFSSTLGGWVDEGVDDTLGTGAGLSANIGKPKAKKTKNAKKKLKAIAEEDEKLNCKVPKSTVHSAKTLLGAIFAAMGEWCWYYPKQIAIKAGLIVFNSAKGLGNTAQFTGYKTASIITSPFTRTSDFSRRMQVNATNAYNRAKEQDGIYIAAGTVAMAIPNKLLNVATGGRRGTSFGKSISETGSSLAVSTPTNALRLVTPRNVVVMAETFVDRRRYAKGDPRRDDATYKFNQALQNWRGFLPFTAALLGESGKDYDEYAKNNAKTDPGAFFYMMRQKELGPTNMPAHELRITAPTARLSNATNKLNTATIELDALTKQLNHTDPNDIKARKALTKQIIAKTKTVTKAQAKVASCMGELDQQVEFLARRYLPQPDVDAIMADTNMTAPEKTSKLLDKLAPHVEANVIAAARNRMDDAGIELIAARDAISNIPSVDPNLVAIKAQEPPTGVNPIIQTVERRARTPAPPTTPPPPPPPPPDAIEVTASQSTPAPAPAPAAELAEMAAAPSPTHAADEEDEPAPVVLVATGEGGGMQPPEPAETLAAAAASAPAAAHDAAATPAPVAVHDAAATPRPIPRPAPTAALVVATPTPTPTAPAPSEAAANNDGGMQPPAPAATTPAAELLVQENQQPQITLRAVQADTPQPRDRSTSIGSAAEEPLVRQGLIDKLKAAFARLEEMIIGKKELPQRLEGQPSRIMPTHAASASAARASAARKAAATVAPEEGAPAAPKATSGTTASGKSRG